MDPLTWMVGVRAVVPGAIVDAVAEAVAQFVVRAMVGWTQGGSPNNAGQYAFAD